ncbi:MAG: isopentenyl-diphosphate Delta-isomerase [Candidatus Paceibacterota bacterium]
MDQTQFSPQLLARQVVLVNEQDEETGQTGLIEAHRGKGLLHRASSVFLFRQNKGKLELLLQQRSSEKILAAGLWANTACGNVSPGEDYRQCITRRLAEELGIAGVTLTELTKYRYEVDCGNGFSENEMDQIFVGWFDGPVTPNLEEVVQAKWVDWQDFLAFMQGETNAINLDEKSILKITDFAPWVNLIINEPGALKPLERFIQ